MIFLLQQAGIGAHELDLAGEREGLRSVAHPDGKLEGPGVVLAVGEQDERAERFLQRCQRDRRVEAALPKPRRQPFGAHGEHPGRGALVDEAHHELVPHLVRPDEIGRAPRAIDEKVRRFHRGEREGRNRGAHEQQHAVEDGARPQPAGGTPREPGKRIIADEADRAMHLRHDLVAGVDARGAADALHLQAVADVDARRADLHAAVAINAITQFHLRCFVT